MNWIKEVETKAKKNVEDAIQSAIRVSEARIKLMSMVNNFPLALELPDNCTIHTWGADIHITIPRDEQTIVKFRNLFAENRARLEELYELVENDDTINTGNISFRFRVCGTWDDIVFTFNPNMQGSTCKLVKIGERPEVRQIPIYEVTCPEGAKEKAL